MKRVTLGVIAITSTMSFACTTTIERKTSDAEPGASTETSSEAWHPKLGLSKPALGRNATTIAALSSKAGASAPSSSPARVRAGGSGGSSCGLSTGDPTCDTCLDTSCCSENTACVNDADCTALISCAEACTDDACFGTCLSAHPTGASLLEAVSTCIDTSCSSACGGPGGGPSGGSPSACGFWSGAPSCDACLDTNCCTAADACFNDADCNALMACAEPCTDGACFSACEAAHPTGKSLMDAISTCADTTCGAACSSVSSGSGSGSTGGSCGLTSGVPTCDTCLDASCCADTTACLGDTDCVALVTCLNGCSDAACASACDAAHPSGSPKLGAVFSCAQSSCSVECGF